MNRFRIYIFLDVINSLFTRMMDPLPFPNVLLMLSPFHQLLFRARLFLVLAMKKHKSRDIHQSVIDRVNRLYIDGITKSNKVIIQGIYKFFMEYNEVKKYA